MKYIVAIIQPERLDEVLDRLEEKEVHLVTVSNVIGRGRQKGAHSDSEIYVGTRGRGTLVPKIKLEIAVNEAFVQPTVDAILAGARTGRIGDGKIFIFDLPNVLRIRTGEEGSVAIG